MMKDAFPTSLASMFCGHLKLYVYWFFAKLRIPRKMLMLTISQSKLKFLEQLNISILPTMDRFSKGKYLPECTQRLAKYSMKGNVHLTSSRPIILEKSYVYLELFVYKHSAVRESGKLYYNK
ncbi:hypothetical protein GQX74_007742 [Glossina fuscipes]|nr:hypothetical protein GQX74_007742 [Glossina fuscipes]